MGKNDFTADSADNYEPKTICCFVVDVSSSMFGKPINELNKGLEEFYSEIKNDPKTADRLEVAIVEFSSTTNTVVTPSLIEGFSMPKLTTKGSTKLVDGVREAVSLVEDRKNWYKQTGQDYNRPWIILITDGAPDDMQDVNGLATEIESKTKDGKFVFLPIGVQDADMAILDQIAGYTQKDESWVKMPPLKLQGLKFQEFFEWVSNSMEHVSSGEPGDTKDLPAPTWIDGFNI